MNSEHYVTSKKLDLVNAIPIVHEETNFLLSDDELKYIGNLDYITNRTNKLSVDRLVLNNKNMKRVREFVNDRMINYIDEVAQVKNEFTMTQSWATITRKSESHHHHDHPNTIFSAVYYAQAEGGLLEFSFKPRIREGYNFTYEIKDWNSFNSVTWRVEVKTGDIVIFPGWISHGTTENDVEVDRIVIGANFFVKGTIGTNEGVDLIEL